MYTPTLPELKPNQSLKMYLDLLVGRIKTNQYFDYDFVTQFTKPNCLTIHTTPITGSELRWAEKIFKLYDGETRNCDDILVLLLDHLKENWFIGKYRYIWAKYEPADEKLLCWAFTWKSFFKVLLGHTHLKDKAKSEWDPAVLKSDILLQQFIDQNGFFLSVWNWDIAIAKNACDFCFEIFDRFIIFQDYKTKKLYMKDNTTGNIEYIWGRKKWWPQMIGLLDYFVQNNKLSITLNEFAELFMTTKYETKKNKPEASALSVHTRAMKDLLKRNFNISDWEKFFTTEDNILTFKQAVSKKDYCWVKR